MSATTTAARRPKKPLLDPLKPEAWALRDIRRLIDEIKEREHLDEIPAFIALRDRYPQLWARLGEHLAKSGRQTRRAA